MTKVEYILSSGIIVPTLATALASHEKYTIRYTPINEPHNRSIYDLKRIEALKHRAGL